MPINKSNTESDLIVKLKIDNIAAFNKLFQEYGKRLYYFAYGYLKSKEDAEGVVQEVFLRIWRNRKQLKPELSFKAYLFKIAYHHILELFEQRNRRLDYRSQIIDEAFTFKDEINERLNYQMLLEKVDSLIELLPPRQKEILVKRKKEGIPVKGIANQLDISPKTVENHLTIAIKKIKKGFGDKGIFIVMLSLAIYRNFINSIF